MSYLFDTNVLIWAAGVPENLSRDVAALLSSNKSERCFSAVSLWEIVIKDARRKPDFRVDASAMRSLFAGDDFRELNVTADHVMALRSLPPIHSDPFDRLLVAQAIIEKLTLVTADTILAQYPADVILM